MVSPEAGRDRSKYGSKVCGKKKKKAWGLILIARGFIFDGEKNEEITKAI